VLGTLLPGRDGCVPLDAAAETAVGQACAAAATSDTAMSKAELKAGAYKPPDLVSGAGHDALALAKLTKVLRSVSFGGCFGGHSGRGAKFAGQTLGGGWGRVPCMQEDRGGSCKKTGGGGWYVCNLRSCHWRETHSEPTILAAVCHVS